MSAIEKKKRHIEILNSIGAYGIPVFAIMAYCVGLSFFAYIGGGFSEISYGDFATHPMFMSTAFLLLGPCAVVMYRLLPNHTAAKIVHSLLQLLAVVFAWIGFSIIWILHAES